MRRVAIPDGLVFSRGLRWWALAAACLVVTAIAPAGDEKKVALSVKQQMPVVQRQFFRLSDPPEQFRRLATDKKEAGLCAFLYGCQIEIGTEYPRLAIKNVTATVTSVKMVLSLEVTLWIGEEGGAKVAAHEEAHRALCEEYYRTAEDIARRLGQEIFGRKLTVPTKNRDDALRAAIAALQEEVLQRYQRAVADRCAFAQERFDAITDHSRIEIPEREAMERAVAEEKAHFASKDAGVK